MPRCVDRSLALALGIVAFACEHTARGGVERVERDTKAMAMSSPKGAAGPNRAIENGERAPSLQASAAVTRRRKPRIPRQPAGKRLQTVAEATQGARDAFESKEDCLALLREGQRAERVAGKVRIAAWNVRWFPDGIPGKTASVSQATDIEWLACTLAYLNVEAVALAEVKPKQRSQPALDELVSRLDALTEGAHAARIDDCPDQNGQHVAWLVDKKRVSVAEWQTHAPINPNGDACSGQLRPGLGVQMRFPGGLDLHAIAVHFKSGVEPRDLELRRTSFDGLERVIASVTKRSGDADVLVMGDFNTMGCRTCANVTRSAAEASWLDDRLRAFRPQARRVPSDLGCSHYYQRQPALLDHFLVTTSTRELDREQVAEIHGHCRELGCDAYSGKDPPAVTHLSDHCPIVLALRDADLD